MKLSITTSDIQGFERKRAVEATPKKRRVPQKNASPESARKAV
jgi:hypothetical protein